MTLHLKDLNADRQLWCAVILQQIEDATSSYVRGATNRRQSNKLRDEARSWLVEPSADFDQTCNLAGLNPVCVRKSAIEQITKSDQRDGARDVRTVTFDGVTRSLGEWSKVIGIPAAVLHHRFKNGLSPEEVLAPTEAKRTTGGMVETSNNAGRPA